MRSVVSVRLSVCFHSIFWKNDLWPRFFAYVWVLTIARRGLKVKVIGQSRVCYMNTSRPIYCGVLRVLIDGGSSRVPSWRYQLRARAARHAAWRGRGQWQRRSPTRVSAVMRSVGSASVWPRYSTEAVFLVDLSGHMSYVTRWISDAELPPSVAWRVYVSRAPNHDNNFREAHLPVLSSGRLELTTENCR